MNHSLLIPGCAQALLTIMVWFYMYYTRLTTLKRKRVRPQDLADASKFDAALNDVVNPSDNLENLFEVPMLFFVAILFIESKSLNDSTYLALAWAFVAFRALHSIIHCTSNIIVYRFSAYIFASLSLWAMWIRLTLQLI
jgi:hypothetical protein